MVTNIKKGMAGALIAGAIVLFASVGNPVPPVAGQWDDQCFTHDVAALNVTVWKPGETANLVTLYPKVGKSTGTVGDTFYGPSPEFLSIHPRLNRTGEKLGRRGDVTQKWVTPLIGRVVECHNARDGSNPSVRMPSITKQGSMAPLPPPEDSCLPPTCQVP